MNFLVPANYDPIKKPLYIALHIVWIFSCKSRTHRTIGSHQIWVFYRRSEQLVGREARRELKEALAHVLGAEASPEATLTVVKHRPSRLTVVGLRCRSPPIKVSINTFPSSLWSRRSKPYRKLTTVARGNWNFAERKPAPSAAGASRLSRRIDAGDSCISCDEPMATKCQIGSKHPSGDINSIGLIRAIDPVANDQHLMKSVDPCAGTGRPGPRCCGHVLLIFLQENNSINPENRWYLGIIQKHP
jgi:hypothetical protein